MLKIKEFTLLYFLHKHFVSVIGWLYLFGVVASGLAAFFDSIGLIAIVSLIQIDDVQGSSNYILGIVTAIKTYLQMNGILAGVTNEVFYISLFLSFFSLKTVLIAAMLIVLSRFKNFYMLKCRQKFYGTIQKNSHQTIQNVGLDRMVNVGTEHINQSGMCFNFFMHFQAQFFSVIVYTIFMLNYISTAFFYIVILVVGVSLIYVKFGKIISENSFVVSTRNDNLTSWIIQLFTSIKSLKFGPGATTFVRKLHESSRIVKDRTNVMDTIAAWLFAIREPIILACVLIILTADGFDSQKTIVALIVEKIPLIFVLYRMFNASIRAQQYLNNALAKYGNVKSLADTFSILEVDNEPENHKKSESVRRTEKIKLVDLLIYTDEVRQKVLLSANDITICNKSRTLILGSSGSGKTSFVDALLKINRNISGKIDFKDALNQSITDEVLARDVSYVEQRSQLFTGSVLFNITFSEDQDTIDQELLKTSLRVSCLDHDFLNSNLTLSTILGDRERQLSGGQQQRLAIARAIYSQAPILIFDEVTSGFDNELADKFVERLVNHSKSDFIFYISHRLLSEQLQYFTDVLLISDGDVQHINLRETKIRKDDGSRIWQYLT